MRPPEQFVADLAGQVIAALRDRSVDEAQRLAGSTGSRRARSTSTAPPGSRSGRYWKSRCRGASASEFAALFKDYVLTSYGRRFHQFADRTFRVDRVRPRRATMSSWRSLVEGGATPIRLDWRLPPTAAGWRVLDIVVEGVSLLVTFRNEFAAVIERQWRPARRSARRAAQPRGGGAGAARRLSRLAALTPPFF